MKAFMEKRRMCPNCRAFIKTSDRVCPYCETAVGPRAVDRRATDAVIGGFIPHARFVTSIILLINCGLYLATVLFSMRNGNSNAFFDLDPRTLVMFGAKYNVLLAYGQWWRLVTAGFLHGGIIHLLMNSWVLFDVGAQVEELYGSSRLIVIYFLATVAGFYLSALRSPSVSVGASAGLCGLIGAMIALGTRHRTPEGLALRGMYVRWMMYLLVLGFVLPGIDNYAHIGGLAAGFVGGYVAGTPKLIETLGERIWRGAAYLAIALTAISFFEMYRFFSSPGL